MYSSVTRARPPKMPRGSVFCGFLTSSAEVATTSKPMKAKNTSAAPAKMPMRSVLRGGGTGEEAEERLLQDVGRAGAGGGL